MLLLCVEYLFFFYSPLFDFYFGNHRRRRESKLLYFTCILAFMPVYFVCLCSGDSSFGCHGLVCDLLLWHYLGPELQCLLKVKEDLS